LNYLSGFLMTKDENRYLREWVAFHRTQGYTKFYIYDNMSETPVAKTLNQEIEEGLVDVTVWEDTRIGRHRRAMDNFLNRPDVIATWVSITDTDEFAFGIENRLSEVLKNHEDKDAVKLGWLCFGSSGHRKIPDGLVIESYTKRGEPESIPGGKSIVKFEIVKNMKDCHNACPIYKTHLIDRSEATINHYITRSKEDWIDKSRRGGGNGGKRSIGLFNKFNKKFNKLEDKTIQKYANKTKIFLGLK
jgi:hypothetical protein